MRIAAVLAFGLALICHAPALAQSAAPAPVPIAEWPLSKISAMGQEIYTGESTASTPLSVDVSRYALGVYVVKVRQENIFLAGRFIKL